MKISVRLRNGSLWIAMLLSLMLAGLTVLGAETAGKTNGTSSATDPAQTYRDFLSNPPWIKKIVYRRDRNYFKIQNGKGGITRLSGLAHYEAGLQPNGFYRRHLEGSMLFWRGGTNEKPVLPGRAISGASKKLFWRLGTQTNSIVLVPRDSQPGASTNNWMRGFFTLEQNDLQTVRKLGLDQLADASIQWIDKDRFVADSTKNGHAEGKIIDYTNGLPEVVEYTVGLDRPKSKRFTVRYYYELDQPFPPYEILVEEVDPHEGKIVHLNYIDELALGTDSNASDGYFPESFRVEKGSFSSVRYSSNAVLYAVDMQGRMHPEDTTYRPLFSLSHGGSRAATTAGVVLVAVTASVFVLTIARKKRRKTLKRL